jgi:hypothetical protein
MLVRAGGVFNSGFLADGANYNYQACPNVAVLEGDKSLKELAKTRI